MPATDGEEAAVLRLPLAGPVLVENSPASRIPSHGSHLFSTTHAIDLVPVDERGRSARFGVRTLVSTEDPTRFVGFGQAVVAPCSGRVIAAHDGEPDHVARRSLPALLVYAATQARRSRSGVGAIAGNHVVLAAGECFVLVAHLRLGSVAVGPGDQVRAGDVLGMCGNSGNSTQPHVHVQAMTDADARVGRGIPLAFRTYAQHRRGARRTERVEIGLPANGVIVEDVSGERPWCPRRIPTSRPTD